MRKQSIRKETHLEVDPEIPAHGLGRCTDNTNNPSEPPQEEESASNTRPEALQKRSRAEILHLVGLPGSCEYFTCDATAKMSVGSTAQSMAAHG